MACNMCWKFLNIYSIFELMYEVSKKIRFPESTVNE